MSEHHKDEAFPGDRSKLVRCIEAVLELHAHGLVKEGIPKMLRQLLRASVLHLNAPVQKEGRVQRHPTAHMTTTELLYAALLRLKGRTLQPADNEAALIATLAAHVKAPMPDLMAENSDLRAQASELGRKLNAAHEEIDRLKERNGNQTVSIKTMREENEKLRECNANQRVSLEALHQAIPKPVNAEILITRAELTEDASGAQYQAYDVQFPRPRGDRLGSVGNHFHALRVVRRIAGQPDDTIAFAEIDRRLTQA